MAKVRVQSRSTEDDGLDEAEKGFTDIPHRKYKGALDVLAKVWKAEGFLGWYQVRRSCFTSPTTYNI